MRQQRVSLCALWLCGLALCLLDTVHAAESAALCESYDGVPKSASAAVPAGMALLPGTLGPMPDEVWIGIVAMSAFLILGQFLSYRAFRLAPVGAIAPFNYTELVWAAIIGWFVWSEWPADNVWWGAAIVVAAGLYVIWRERVRAQRLVAGA